MFKAEMSREERINQIKAQAFDEIVKVDKFFGLKDKIKLGTIVVVNSKEYYVSTIASVYWLEIEATSVTLPTERINLMNYESKDIEIF